VGWHRDQFSTQEAMMKVIVDRDLCEGHARCVEAAPAVFEIGDDDEMHVLDENPGEEQRRAAETAVVNCPRQALSLQD
jgi:ferredoxin